MSYFIYLPPFGAPLTALYTHFGKIEGSVNYGATLRR